MVNIEKLASSVAAATIREVLKFAQDNGDYLNDEDVNQEKTFPWEEGFVSKNPKRVNVKPHEGPVKLPRSITERTMGVSGRNYDPNDDIPVTLDNPQGLVHESERDQEIEIFPWEYDEDEGPDVITSVDGTKECSGKTKRRRFE